MNKTTITLSAAALLALPVAAHADSIQFGADGIGAMTLNAGTINGIMDEPTDGPGVFRGSHMRTVHEHLQADGITTDGFVTVMLANTTQGLTMFTLVDDPVPANGSPDPDSWLGFDASMDANTSMYVNDLGGDLEYHEESGGMHNASGVFEWSSEGRGDGLAYTGMSVDSEFSFTFYDEGTEGLGSLAFQFVTWNGDEWEVVAQAGFDGEGMFQFGSTIVPIPSAIALGIAGLAGVSLRRRRRDD